MELFEYKILLDKYYDGQTSETEEMELRNYLRDYNGDNDEFITAKTLFNALDEDSIETVDIDFNTLINTTKIVSFRKKQFLAISSVAAVFLIGLVLITLIKVIEKPVVYAYIDGKPVTDKEVAIAHSKKALYNISSQLNKGTNGLRYMNKMNTPVELLTVKK